MCLGMQDNYLVKKLCNEDDISQMWKIDRSNDDQIKQHVKLPRKLNNKKKNLRNWKNKEGKHVVLTHASNPWFLGKDTVIPSHPERHESEYITNKLSTKDLYELNNLKYDYLPVKSDIVLDKEYENIGYGLGYSFADRQMKPCNNNKNCFSNYIHDIDIENLHNLAAEISNDSNVNATQNTVLQVGGDLTMDEPSSKFCIANDSSYCTKRMCCIDSGSNCGSLFKSCIARIDSQEAKDKDVTFEELVNHVGTNGNCKKTITNTGRKRYTCSIPTKVIPMIVDNNPNNSKNTSITNQSGGYLIEPKFLLLLSFIFIIICVFTYKRN